jgi:hypothetical protein
MNSIQRLIHASQKTQAISIMKLNRQKTSRKIHLVYSENQFSLSGQNTAAFNYEPQGTYKHYCHKITSVNQDS